MKLKKGTVKRLHVDRRVMYRNIKEGRNDPAITVQTSKGAYKCKGIKWAGASEFIQSIAKPLSCGARLWIETKAELELIGVETT